MEFIPYEIMLDIFRHIRNDCDQVKQVCKRFYLLNCQLNKSKKDLYISDKELQDKGTYNSMIFSKKVFNKMTLYTNQILTLDSFRKLRTICSLKASSITELTWTSTDMTVTEIISILNFFTNLRSLRCDFWRIQTEFYDEPLESLKLNSLKSLTIARSNEAAIDLFANYLPANSLTKLETDFYCKNLIENHSGLNDLNFSTDELSDDWVAVPLTHLRMRLQKYRNDNQPVLLSILKQQPNLISLDVMRCNGIFDGDDESFVTLCSLQDLKTLKMNIDDLNQIVFKENFGNLNKLEELHIESVDGEYPPLIDIIEELSNTRLDQLKILNIDVEHISVPLSRIENMANNFRHLTKLAYKCELPLPLHIYLKNFKALTDLEIDYHYSQEFSLMCSNLDDLVFPLINRIKLKGFNFGSDVNLNEPAFSKLVKVLPNVIEMEVEINIPLNTKFFDINLKRLPKVRTFKDLTLVHQKDNYEKFDADCVNYFIRISDKFESFTVELRLKAIDMDVQEMKTMLSKKYKFNMKRFGSEIVINLCKK